RVPTEPRRCRGRPWRRCGRAPGGGRTADRARLPGRICLALRTLPSDLTQVFRETKTPLETAGFFVGRLDAASLKRKGRDMSRPFVSPCFSSYQLRKQRRPYGPECQPGGQLYIGRQPP